MISTDAMRAAVPLDGGDCWAPLIGELTNWFSRWLDQTDPGENLRPAFDRWVRDSLNQFLGARRVRCFQIVAPDGYLAPLTGDLEDVLPGRLRACGLVDHVITSGRRYVRDTPGNGELIERLAQEWRARYTEAPALLLPPPDWLVPVRDRGRTLGLVIVGELPEDKRKDPALLQATGHLLELFWRHAEQAQALALARRTDRASGVLNRLDLAAAASEVLQEASADGEPTALLVLAVEGVRRLDDQGRWQLRDWLMKQVGRAMRRKLRSDDLVGRFSDEKFVAVLRRLDMSLGQLVAAKLLEMVNDEVSQQPVVREMVQVRCGLTEGTSQGFEAALRCVAEALDQARRQGSSLVVAPPAEPARSGHPEGAPV